MGSGDVEKFSRSVRRLRKPAVAPGLLCSHPALGTKGTMCIIRGDPPRRRSSGTFELSTSNSDTGGEFSGSATMLATALVREVESARESRPAELSAREQAVDLEFATSVNSPFLPLRVLCLCPCALAVAQPLSELTAGRITQPARHRQSGAWNRQPDRTPRIPGSCQAETPARAEGAGAGGRRQNGSTSETARSAHVLGMPKTEDYCGLERIERIFSDFHITAATASVPLYGEEDVGGDPCYAC